MAETRGWPIRIAVRVDFSDGAEHTYDVRAEDAVALPPGGAFWPEGVVTPDVAKRMEHDRRRQEEIARLRAERDEAVDLLEAALFLRMNGQRPPGAPADDPEAETWAQWDRKTEAFLRARLTRLHPGLPQDLPGVEVIPRESWRAETWDADTPSRPGWQVRCAAHGYLGSPPGWAYEDPGKAQMVATRHRNAKHARPALDAAAEAP